MKFDTIVAISTPYGESGIGIVRVSGEKAFHIGEKIYKGPKKKLFSQLNDHTVNYGWIIDFNNNKVIDEIFITVLKGPKTYTREDMIEINCHGGWYTMNMALELIVMAGARIAEPGEFTKRAFLNGRIDLSQAEAVLEIIQAKNDRQHSGAIKRLGGKIKYNIEELKKRIFNVFLKYNASIDFINDSTFNNHNDIEGLKFIIYDISEIIKKNKKYLKLNEGIKSVICGKTNVGKSTILNRIYGSERAITSGIPGTTRDTLNIEMNINGFYYNIIDTAGIRPAKGIIENISINKAKKEIIDSDIIIMVIDISRRLNNTDIEIINWIKTLNKEIIWIGNKCDLHKKINFNRLNLLIEQNEIIEISAKENKGIDRLIDDIQIKSKRFGPEINDGIQYNKRQIIQLEKCNNHLKKAMDLINNKWGQEVIIEEIRKGIYELDRITNLTKDIEEIFSKFCIGK